MRREVEFIRELPVSPTGAEQCLVKQGERYFIVSSVVARFSGYETLVFPSDATGEVSDWGEVAGGRGCSREQAIADLAEAEWCNHGERKDYSW